MENQETTKCPLSIKIDLLDFYYAKWIWTEYKRNFEYIYFFRADNCVTPLALFEKSVLCFFKARLKNKRLAKKLTYLITDSKNYGDFLKKWQPFVKKDIEIEVYTNPISDFSEYMLFYVNSFSRDKRSIDKEAKYYHNLYAGKKIKNMRLLYKKWLKGNSYARQFYSVEDAVNLEPRPIFPG